MSSAQLVQVGNLSEWLRSATLSEWIAALSTEATESISNCEVISMSTARKSIYESLLSELHTLPVLVDDKRLQQLCHDPREYVMCLWRDVTLVATAQASLLFPAGVPTVHVSNVVVGSAFRGQGMGKFLLMYLHNHIRKTWGSEWGELRFELTSREERGTRAFYEGLGYTGVNTTRYSL